MLDLFHKAKEFKMSRRSFIGWSSAVAATAAIPVSRGLVTKAAGNDDSENMDEGVWKTAACWHNCGSRCLNKVLVKDGMVIRQKTDDTHSDSPDFPQQRGCLRGRSQRQQVFGADRIKYPMKRKNWKPGGGKKELRGKDQWVRISWDEALEIVSSEIMRISEKYGNEALWATGEGEITKVLSANGGCVTDWGTTSRGAWKIIPPMMGVGPSAVEGINDRMDLKNSQLIVLWGINTAWSAAGNRTYNLLQAKKAGARFISIDPMYNDTAHVLGADWVPVRPSTDHALVLGMMYALLEEDDPQNNPLIDWDFLNRCTTGFDIDHMPAGADPKDNFKDYLLGTYDKIPKTSDWASDICGVDPLRIRELARQIGSTNRVALLTGWAPARINEGEGWVRAFSTLGFMTGHMGRPGRMTGVSCHTSATNGGPALIKGGSDGYTSVTNPVTDTINHNEIFKAVLEGKFRQLNKGEERKANIQLMYHQYNATMQTRTDITSAIKAARKVEFVVTHAYVLTTNAKYSDVVLPVTTEWETEGGLLVGNREILIGYSKITDPLYEAKTDVWIAKELMKKLGKNPEEIYPFDEKQAFFNKLATSKVIDKNGAEFELLLTITDADIKEWGVQGEPQMGRVGIKEFLDNGIYQVERKPGDPYGAINYKKFVEDPDNNPLKTETGKFEIYCKKIADKSKLEWTEQPIIPKYLPKPKGYESTFADWKSKKKGKYPFQVFNPHYLRRSHSVFDNVSWLREAWPNPVFLNKSDAEKLGIKEGETVLLSNEFGKTLRPAHLTETMMPGVIGLPHGAWVEMDEDLGVDKSGADNILCGPISTGFGTSGWNTANCNLEKWDGEPLEEDVKWPQRIIKF